MTKYLRLKVCRTILFLLKKEIPLLYAIDCDLPNCSNRRTGFTDFVHSINRQIALGLEIYLNVRRFLGAAKIENEKPLEKTIYRKNIKKH